MKDQKHPEPQYNALVEKIRKKLRLVKVFAIIAEAAILIFTTPSSLTVMGDHIYQYGGLHPAWTFVLMVLCALFFLFLYASAILPLQTSFTEECDPEKHMILNMYLNKNAKRVDREMFLALDYLYLGNYTQALYFADRQIGSHKDTVALSALSIKARCEFFSGAYERFRETAALYHVKLTAAAKLSQKQKEAYASIGEMIDLLRAFADNDREKTALLREKITAWNQNKPTVGFVNYLKGVAAYRLDDYEEAADRFKAVKETCAKTVFSTLADEHLDWMK